MSNKKLFMSVTASAVIASAFIGAGDAEAASYKVKSGDSLWEIAQQYDTSVGQLKSINGLSGNLIFPNQVLETSNSSNSGSDANASEGNTSNSTYTVKSGDTLSGIAFKHNISVADLMKWNGMDTTLIYPGNEFVVSKNGSTGGSHSSDANVEAPSSNNGGSGNTASASVYTVKSGDTLSGIAYRHDVSVADLKRWNGLNSSLILIGQKLNIGASAGSSNAGASDSSNSNSSSNAGSSVDTDYNVNELINVAKSMNGVDYEWGGQTPAGFDCSGFIYYAYNQAGKDIGRLSSEGYYNRAFYVNNPQVGDLAFFENTYTSGISHVGIYVGNNSFISATSDGVEIVSLDNPYWSKHFEGFKRFY